MSDSFIFPDAPGEGSIDGSGTFDAEPESGVFFSGADAEDTLDVSFAEAEHADLLAGDGVDSEDPPPPPKAAKKSRSKTSARGRSKDNLVLGVHVTPKRVYGVLIRPTETGYEPLRQFVRNRAESQFGDVALSPDALDDEMGFDIENADIAADDPTIQFGGTGEVDFSAEFAGLGVVTDAALDTTATAGEVAARAQPIVFELRDMLDECAQAGYARPALAFAIDEPDVAYAEITVPPPKKAKKSKKKKSDDDTDSASEAPVKRDRLVELLPNEGEFAGVDRSRVAFVPMTPRDGLRRFLAVGPTGSEPVAESLTMLREQGSYRKVGYKTLEAEVPLLVGLVGLTLAPESHENTAIVRVGAEDTVVLLLAGDRIHHYELMQSVTAFDGPDTICSRVLLQQDVQGVGTVHNVVVVAEEREKELVQGFSAFYPEARVETLREGVARLGLVGPYGPLAPMLVEAAGVAVAGHLIKQKGSPFVDANLLPSDLLKRKRRVDLSFAWHTLVIAAALFLSVLYFSYRYVSQDGEIAAAEKRLAEFPPEAQMSVPQLQARIDSLRMRQATITEALIALDSILVDTDRWTQTLLRTTRAAAQTGGIWIESWSPAGNDVQLAGYATTRANVVGIAQRLSASIEEVTFEALREYPVYQYRLRFTQAPELPQVTRVLREQAIQDAIAAEPPPADGLDAPAPTAPSEVSTEAQP